MLRNMNEEKTSHTRVIEAETASEVQLNGGSSGNVSDVICGCTEWTVLAVGVMDFSALALPVLGIAIWFLRKRTYRARVPTCTSLLALENRFLESGASLAIALLTVKRLSGGRRRRIAGLRFYLPGFLFNLV
jgi:hypothetical protein